MRIFVTGAARGLGAALMEEGIRRGHKMAGGVRVLHGEGPEGLILPMDVTDGGQVKQAAAALAAHWNALDVLINNAGVIQPDFDSYFAPGRDALSAMPMEELERLTAVNFVGPIRVTQAFWPLLQAGERPQILHITSEAGSLALNGALFEPYSLSKTAMNVAARRMAEVLKGRARVLAIHPGRMRTPMSGGQGEIEAAEAARGIFDLIEGHTKAENWFVDYLGRRMPE